MSEVPGLYVATFVRAGEAAQLELLEDSTWIHTYATLDGDTITDKGRWGFRARDFRVYSIVLWDFVVRFPRLGRCYCPEDNGGAIDTAPHFDRHRLYRVQNQMYILFCYDPYQRYVRDRPGEGK